MSLHFPAPDELSAASRAVRMSAMHGQDRLAAQKAIEATASEAIREYATRCFAGSPEVALLNIAIAIARGKSNGKTGCIHDLTADVIEGAKELINGDATDIDLHEDWLIKAATDFSDWFRTP